MIINIPQLEQHGFVVNEIKDGVFAIEPHKFVELNSIDMVAEECNELGFTDWHVEIALETLRSTLHDMQVFAAIQRTQTTDNGRNK